MVRITHDRQVRYTLDDVLAVAAGAPVELDAETVAFLDERRAEIVAFVTREQRPAYGFNRGFGHNVDVPVPRHKLGELQTNLIRSHAAGVGPAAPREVVRATMFLRATSLACGHSGVRALVVETLVALLNAQITPVVPCFGSVGASGDLAPLSHVALALIGEGRVFVGDADDPVAAGDALAMAGIVPLQLEMKEGLALNNGVQFSTALGILSWARLRRLLRTSAVATALTAQVVLGADTPFDESLHALRPHPGALTVARWIRDLMADSPIRKAHQPYDVDGEVQEPYNVRCAAQILGTCQDLLQQARATFETEANSVTDNPILLPDPDNGGAYTRIVSGGHFHGMPVAVQLYHLIEAAGILARLSNMRCVRYVDEARNKGLGSDLKWPGLAEDDAAVSSAMMIPEYVSAALTNAIWGAAMPSHLFSLSTDAGQEDHVSMSAGLAVRVWETLPRLAEVVAIELAYAAQAAAIRREMDHFPSKKSLTEEQEAAVESARRGYEQAINETLGGPEFGVGFSIQLRYRWEPKDRLLSPVCEAVLAQVREHFPIVTQDRCLSDDLAALARAVERGEIERAATDVVALDE